MLKFGKDPPGKKRHPKKGQDTRHPTRPAAVRPRAPKPRAPPFSREIPHLQHEFRGSSNLATLTITEALTPPRVHDAPREVVHPCIFKGAKTTTPAGPLAS